MFVSTCLTILELLQYLQMNFKTIVRFEIKGEQEKEMTNTTVEEFLEYKIKISELSNEIRTIRSRLLMYNDLERRKYKRVDTHGL